MTDNLNASLEARDLRYAARLAEMIRCRTVSKKDSFEPTEFLKLRQVIAELFPLMTARAELTILGDDTYLYKLAGTDATRNVMVMSHHDVVDAAGEWQEPPFGGDSKDGRLWGRGTVDTKTPLFAEFTAIEELLEAGFVFPVNVYLFSSCNEEIGGNGAPLALEYFRKNGLRFDWIIDEGGAVIDPPMAGIDCKCAMMAVHEKGRCTARLIAKNLPGHAGLEGGHKTPVMRMAAFIAEADEKKPYIRRLHPEVRGMFEAMAPHMKFPMGFVFSHLGMFERLLIKLIPKLNAADARQFTDLSDTVIRFAPIDIDKQQYASVHGENENISVDKLHLAVDFYKALLRNYPAYAR